MKIINEAKINDQDLNIMPFYTAAVLITNWLGKSINANKTFIKQHYWDRAHKLFKDLKQIRGDKFMDETVAFARIIFPDDLGKVFDPIKKDKLSS